MRRARHDGVSPQGGLRCWSLLAAAKRTVRGFWYNTSAMEEKVKAKLEELRAGLQADGGDLELVKIEGKVVYLKLVGHCGSCPFAMMTLKQGIEAGLQEIDPEITVERVEA